MTAPEPAGRLPELAALLRRTAGLSVERSRLDALRSALERASEAEGAPPDEYLDRLLSGAAPLQPVLDRVTVGETYFFRDREQWEFVESTVLPAVTRRRTSAGVRAWSAGCSTGEEPYTLAVLLLERGLASGSAIVGSDISQAALERARRAEYSLWSLRGGVDPRLRRRLTETDGRFTLAPEVRRLVSFVQLNLAEPRYPSRGLGLHHLDLVLCRNVLIYLAPEVVRDVARRLFDSLAPGGWLLTGASDPLLSRDAPFRVESGAHGLAYRRPPEPLTAPPRRDELPTRGVRQAPRAAPPPPGRMVRVPSAPLRPLPVSPVDPVCAQCRELLDAGRVGDARLAVDEALARSPLSAELHLMRALVLTELGDLAGAESACRRAVYLDRDAPFPHFFRAMLRLQAGDRAAAARGLRTVVSLCAARPADEEIPLSSGLTAGGLANAARFQLEALGGV